MPMRTAKTTVSARTGTPRASATSGSVLANSNGRYTIARTISTSTEHASSSVSPLVPTPTIWPTSSEKLVPVRPG